MHQQNFNFKELSLTKNFIAVMPVSCQCELPLILMRMRAHEYTKTGVILLFSLRAIFHFTVYIIALDAILMLKCNFNDILYIYRLINVYILHIILTKYIYQ